MGDTLGYLRVILKESPNHQDGRMILPELLNNPEKYLRPKGAHFLTHAIIPKSIWWLVKSLADIDSNPEDKECNLVINAEAEFIVKVKIVSS